MQTSYPAGLLWMFDVLNEDLDKMSGGRIHVTAYADGVLVPTDEFLDALSEGTIDMAVTCGAYYGDVMPVGNCVYMPFSRDNGDDLEHIYGTGGFAELLREGYAEHGAHFITYTMNAPYEILTTVPVRTLDDLKPLKIRCIGSMAPMFAELGVSTMYLPGSELYTSMQTGIIDGVLYGGAGDYNDAGFFEVAPYLLRPAVVNPCSDDILMRQDLWNTLPEDIQAILTNALKVNARIAYAKYQRDEYEVLAEVQNTLGVEVSTLSEADQKEIRTAAARSWEEFAAMSPLAAKGVQAWKDWLITTGRM